MSNASVIFKMSKEKYSIQDIFRIRDSLVTLLKFNPSYADEDLFLAVNREIEEKGGKK